MGLVDLSQYLPRAIYDLSPMSLHLHLGIQQGFHHWRIEANWLQEEYVRIACTKAICHYWVENHASGSRLLPWKAFKATLREVFIAKVRSCKFQLASTVSEVENAVSLAEAAYVREPTPGRLVD